MSALHMVAPRAHADATSESRSPRPSWQSRAVIARTGERRSGAPDASGQAHDAMSAFTSSVLTCARRRRGTAERPVPSPGIAMNNRVFRRPNTRRGDTAEYVVMRVRSVSARDPRDMNAPACDRNTASNAPAAHVATRHEPAAVGSEAPWEAPPVPAKSWASIRCCLCSRLRLPDRDVLVDASFDELAPALAVRMLVLASNSVSLLMSATAVRTKTGTIADAEAPSARTHADAAPYPSQRSRHCARGSVSPSAFMRARDNLAKYGSM